MTSFTEHLDGIAAQSPGQNGCIAFFDLDRTLISGYSITALARETARHAAASGEMANASRLVREVLQQRADGSGGNYHRLVKRVARALTGVTEETLYALGRRAASNHLERTLYREAIELVEAHRAAGHHLVIVTAASRYQVEPLAAILGIEDICCSQLVVEGGQFTGEVVAPLCYGEGKTLAARRVARRRKTRLSRCYFYTDSSADLPLLKAVGNPVAVNPSTRLADHASEQGWPQLTFSSRGRPDLGQVLRTGALAQTLLATALTGRAASWMGSTARQNANLMTRLLGDVGSGCAGLNYEVEGRKHLQRSAPAIYVFNHQSLLDAVVLAHLLRDDVVGLCKQEMASSPIIGPLLKQVDTIFVDREQQDQSDVIARALATLDSGRSLVIAPEGTRSTLGQLQPFKMGAFVLARKAGVPVIPIVLHNVKDALPKGARVIKPATIRITVLPPIPPEHMRRIRPCCHQLEATYSAILGESRAAALPHSASARAG
ncbi:hypothetical protein A3709_05705 [Halioglobus sp. HI00S01]|uniref:HAD-IB family hydrolase n=1 Tax=Halioglobus sp. HI00S01 TaxID=1822214 RepID=UPI0007C227DB|nr:HAD-IB family hydrolase [Halioglobus sp. HI00S01]KZX56590.1 hypothetical protein A3709_05705 [Halioglobus sp. HI00S01]